MLTYALILNYNSAEETLELYNQLKTFYKEELHIFIIDNCSEKEDVLKLRSSIPEQELLISNKNLGYAGGNNIGIRKAIKKGAKYIWILNPDIRVQKDSLSILRETLVLDKKNAAVGPRINYRIAKNKIFSNGGLFIQNEKCTTFHKNQNELDSIHQGEINYNIDYIDGSCIFLKVDAIKNVGFFPEEYFLYFEETDWCMKAKENGYQICINSNTRVFNIESEKGSTFHYYMMKNRLLFAKKYHPNLNLVKQFYGKTLLKEFFMRFRGNYFKPFYFSRLKGFLVGYLKTL